MTENLYHPNSIRTYSGKYVNVFDPNPDTILIEDIARSLSKQCRFGGHTGVFLPVSIHCVMVANLLPDDLKLQGLLHDASEAYMMDIPSPIKKNIVGYEELETRLMKIIFAKFCPDAQYPLHEKVKEADKDQLQWEWDKFMVGGEETEYTPDYAYHHFITKYNELKK